MEQYLSKLDEIQTKVGFLRNVCEENNLDPAILSGFSTNKIKDIYFRLLKHYKQHPQKAKTMWFQSELKLFSWILVSYSFVNTKKIQNFTVNDWACFKEIFHQKDIITFKYEVKRLLSENPKTSRIWKSEEESILIMIMNDGEMKNKWNEVGRRLYETSSERYFRTAKQCRQHWLNHLDPQKKHGKWESEEDKIILKFVLDHGKKWSFACKHILPHRTQHMIKNRFKSLLSKFWKTRGSDGFDQNLITKKILDFYKRKQIRETANWEELISEVPIKIPNTKRSKKVENDVLIEKEEQREAQNPTDMSESKQTKQIVNLRKMENSQFICSQNLYSAPSYQLGSIPMGFIYPSYEDYFQYYDYWSQIN